MHSFSFDVKLAVQNVIFRIFSIHLVQLQILPILPKVSEGLSVFIHNLLDTGCNTNSTIILDTATNDLAHASPEVVGSAFDGLVHFILNHFLMHVLGLCHVITWF